MFPDNVFLANSLLAVIGVTGGLLVSGGVFTVLLAVGLVPRFAGKTHTGRKIFLYEEMVVSGTLFGNVMSVFEYPFTWGEWLSRNPVFGVITPIVFRITAMGFLIVFGFCAGIFVGCLALAIAEMLDTIPIFARRIQFRHGLGIAVLATALGKLAGSLYYFWGQFFRIGE